MTRYPVRWVVAALATAVSLAAALAWVGLGESTQPDQPAAPMPPAATSEAPAFAAGHPAASPSADEQSPAAAPGSRRATAILRAWDARRADAYARGSVAVLGDLYADGSDAGTSDVAMLRGYLRRGLRVDDLRMQLLAVRVLENRPGLWRLRVTDRVHSGVVVGPGGASAVLPRDRASTRVLILRRATAGREWKVAAVRRSTQPRAGR